MNRAWPQGKLSMKSDTPWIFKQLDTLSLWDPWEPYRIQFKWPTVCPVPSVPPVHELTWSIVVCGSDVAWSRTKESYLERLDCDSGEHYIFVVVGGIGEGCQSAYFKWEVFGMKCLFGLVVVKKYKIHTIRGVNVFLVNRLINRI